MNGGEFWVLPYTNSNMALLVTVTLEFKKFYIRNQISWNPLNEKITETIEKSDFRSTLFIFLPGIRSSKTTKYPKSVGEGHFTVSLPISNRKIFRDPRVYTYISSLQF